MRVDSFWIRRLTGRDGLDGALDGAAALVVALSGSGRLGVVLVLHVVFGLLRDDLAEHSTALAHAAEEAPVESFAKPLKLKGLLETHTLTAGTWQNVT